MNEFIESLRADLLSRRLLPFVGLALLALAVAVGYALGGGSQASTVSRGPSSPLSGSTPAALAVTAASPNPNAAEAETPGGLRYQSRGGLNDPFKPFAEPQSATVGGAASAVAHGSSSPSSGGSSAAPAGPGGSGSGSGGTGTGKSGGGEPAPTPPKPSSPRTRKPSFPYDVSILFGKLPATPGQEVTLPPYQSLQPQRPLPSAGDARIALERVGGNTKSAVFALLAPTIPRGQGVCLPSPSECQQLALEAGRAEELEYIEASGQVVVYELKTVSIVKKISQAAG
jgi:hypothetical protein